MSWIWYNITQYSLMTYHIKRNVISNYDNFYFYFFASIQFYIYFLYVNSILCILMCDFIIFFLAPLCNRCDCNPCHWVFDTSQSFTMLPPNSSLSKLSFTSCTVNFVSKTTLTDPYPESIMCFHLETVPPVY